MRVEITDDYIDIYEEDQYIVGWSSEEWEEDPKIIISIATAIKLAYKNPARLKILVGNVIKDIKIEEDEKKS